MNGSVLLIASNAALLAAVRRSCEVAGARLDVVASLDAARFDGVALVICSEGDLVPVRQRAADASVIVYGDGADSTRAIEAIKYGAFDYCVPPFTPETLAPQIRAAVRIVREDPRPATYEPPRDRSPRVDRIIGQSPAMQDVYKAIGRIAPRDINVLITGESGTGKELVARAIVHHSPRSDRPYLAVNCAAIPETLLESELFGHEKGAFTGAERRHTGKFEQCHGGTLFLDEIGDIPLPTQAKLLRVLQEQSFQRLGGVDVISCDVRILAATHQPLDRLMDAGDFRKDLYYRLNVANIEIPPLREREVDVVLLAHYFVERYNAEFDTQIRAFAPETLRVLLRYDWPGNVRQLENVVRATLVHARGSVLRLEFLPPSVREEPSSSSVASDVDRDATLTVDDALSAFAAVRVQRSGGAILHDAVADLERELIRAALRHSGGRVAPAARHLGISRTTLRRKMDLLGIQVTTT